MRLSHLLPLISALAIGSAHAAPDGAALYTTYCSACHGTDGVGPEGNVNPPLAKSEWLLGEPDRAIAAVLHGLVGPIEVRGKLYNLAMPPQGAVLDDQQLAAIIGHVRTSFGNVRDNAKKSDIEKRLVKPEEIAAIRAELSERKGPFTAAELKEKYPIPHRQGWPRLENLRSTLYHGKWEQMPDFSQLEPVAYEEEPRNLVDVAHADRISEFAIVWEADIITRKEGDYGAVLSASDGARLFINGKEIVHVEGIGQMTSERTRRLRFRMPKGKSTFRLEYFNNQGNPGLVLAWQGPTGAPYLSESRLEMKHTPPPIMLAAEEGRPAIYRNFIEGARPKVIGVGYPDGVNQAFSIPHLGPDLVWQGDFIDAGRHWTNRGQGFEAPAGDDVVQLLNAPAYALIATDDAAWPQRGKNPLETHYLGYEFADATEHPTFLYELGNVGVADLSRASVSGEKRSLVRTITFTVPAGGTPEGLQLCLAKGPQITANAESSQTFRIDDKVSISASGSLQLRTIDEPHLVMPLDFDEGTHSVEITYTW